MIFVRSALGPDSRPHLEVVRLAETVDDRGFAMVRTRAPFAPQPPGGAATQYAFGDPVVLVRAPFRISFGYSGPDRVWADSWGPADRLPDAVRITVRDSASGQALAASTATRLLVTASGVARPPTPLRRRPANRRSRAPTGRGRRPTCPGSRSNESQRSSTAPEAPRTASYWWRFSGSSPLWRPSASIYSIYADPYGRRLPCGGRPLASAGFDSRRRRVGGASAPGRRQSRCRRRTARSRPGSAQTAVAVRYSSERGRIDLNAAPKELLAGLFAAIGVDEAQAADYVDRILAWRTKAETRQPTSAVGVRLTSRAGLPYPPRQAPFNDPLELSLVLGLSPDVAERILPDVTVFSGAAASRRRQRERRSARRLAAYDARDPAKGPRRPSRDARRRSSA